MRLILYDDREIPCQEVLVNTRGFIVDGYRVVPFVWVRKIVDD